MVVWVVAGQMGVRHLAEERADEGLFAGWGMGAPEGGLGDVHVVVWVVAGQMGVRHLAEERAEEGLFAGWGMGAPEGGLGDVHVVVWVVAGQAPGRILVGVAGPPRSPAPPQVICSHTYHISVRWPVMLTGSSSGLVSVRAGSMIFAEGSC